MILALILVLINIRIFMAMKKTQPVEAAEPVEAVKAKSAGGEWTVYGSMGCGWTRKQLDYFKDAGMSFTFVDCDSEDCPGIDAFPTTVDASGEETVGFKEF